jgi:hypothetical protein
MKFIIPYKEANFFQEQPVSTLIRLAYSSKATFEPFSKTESKLDPRVADILHVARENNRKNRLYGALYYGNGNFFQCLEGSEQDINTLYEKLLRDPRHKDLKILLREPIERVSFGDWEMKFALVDEKVRGLLREHQLSRFNPEAFDRDLTRKLVSVLQSDRSDVPDQVIETSRRDPVPVAKTRVPEWMWVAMVLLIAMVAYLLLR